jgi:hypothetical protein
VDKFTHPELLVRSQRSFPEAASSASVRPNPDVTAG